MDTKPLKILTIGDAHFKVNNTEESLEMCEKIYKLIDEEDLDIIINMGDTLNDHERIHVVPLSNSIKYLMNLCNKTHKLTGNKLDNYLIIGNHDLSNNNAFLSTYHPFNGLSNIDNLTVVDRVIIKEYNGMKFCFAPYVHPGRLFEELFADEKLLNKHNIKDIKVVFGHHEIYGGQMGPVVSTAGDKWPLDYPFFISGHIHDYSRPQENVVYVGTPMQHAFGDRDDKTVSIWTIYPDKIPIEKRIDLGLKKKIVITLKCSEAMSFVPNTKYNTKLRIEGTDGEIKAFQKLDFYKNLIKKGIKITFINIIENNSIRGDITKALTPNGNRISYLEGVKNEAIKNEDIYYWYVKLYSNSL